MKCEGVMVSAEAICCARGSGSTLSLPGGAVPAGEVEGCDGAPRWPRDGPAAGRHVIFS